jgi:enoyl-CoA hydratase/carnithine racemase
MSTDELLVRADGPLLTVTFNRPEQRNAMTWSMYDGLFRSCELADQDDTIRVMVLRGAGRDAFVAGTDITQFSGFADGQDGVAYEERISRVVGRLEQVTVPTVAAVRGYCVGGGLALAAVCDLRVATRTAKFGVPIARTLGNCLSMNSYSLLVHHLGPARTLDMLLRARMISAEQAHAAGFVAELCDDAGFDEVVSAVVATLVEHAPLTMWATKEAVRRLRLAALPDGDDVVAKVFGSQDFRDGVSGFLRKEKVKWQGR